MYDELTLGILANAGSRFTESSRFRSANSASPAICCQKCRFDDATPHEIAVRRGTAQKSGSEGQFEAFDCVVERGGPTTDVGDKVVERLFGENFDEQKATTLKQARSGSKFILLRTIKTTLFEVIVRGGGLLLFTMAETLCMIIANLKIKCSSPTGC